MAKPEITPPARSIRAIKPPSPLEHPYKDWIAPDIFWKYLTELAGKLKSPTLINYLKSLGPSALSAEERANDPLLKASQAAAMQYFLLQTAMIVQAAINNFIEKLAESAKLLAQKEKAMDADANHPPEMTDEQTTKNEKEPEKSLFEKEQKQLEAYQQELSKVKEEMYQSSFASNQKLQEARNELIKEIQAIKNIPGIQKLTSITEQLDRIMKDAEENRERDNEKEKIMGLKQYQVAINAQTQANQFMNNDPINATVPHPAPTSTINSALDDSSTKTKTKTSNPPLLVFTLPLVAELRDQKLILDLKRINNELQNNVDLQKVLEQNPELQKQLAIKIIEIVDKFNKNKPQFKQAHEEQMKALQKLQEIQSKVNHAEQTFAEKSGQKMTNEKPTEKFAQQKLATTPKFQPGNQQATNQTEQEQERQRGNTPLKTKLTPSNPSD